MTTSHKINVAPMTAETFAPFGELWDVTDRPDDRRQVCPTRYTYVGKTVVSVIWLPYGVLTFNKLERHFGVTQCFVQLSGSPTVVCVAAPTKTELPTDVPDPADVRAFLIHPEKGYSLNRGTWHTNRYGLAPPGSTFLVLNSDPNPTQIVNYEASTVAIYQDLGSDLEPESLDHEAKFDIVFEFTP